MAKAQRFDLLIFDWDGTLADSVGQIVATMQQAIAALGLPPRADQQISELIGLGFSDSLTRLYPQMDMPTLLRLLREYRERAPGTAYAAPLFAGAAESLSALRDDGYLLAVATGKPRAGLQRSLASHTHLQPLFTITRCADETANKPDPLMLREILAETGIAAERALMIGDTEYDIAMARAIGVPALGVACGVHDAGRQLRAGALAVVESARAVPGWLAAKR
ncbi:MAG: family hydrolase [Nevskia sp.]|nr:family hydrolase [Nevskia sp.]